MDSDRTFLKVVGGDVHKAWAALNELSSSDPSSRTRDLLEMMRMKLRGKENTLGTPTPSDALAHELIELGIVVPESMVKISSRVRLMGIIWKSVLWLRRS